MTAPGELLASLLLDTAWVHRRVESLRMDANGGTRLMASLDVTLPLPGLVRNEERVILPLALVQKGALRRLDTSDHQGNPMPVLDTRDNGELVVEMLTAIGRSVLPALVTASPRYESVIRKIVFGAPAEHEVNVATFRGWLSAFGVDPDASDHDVFTSMVAQFSNHFLLAVEVSADVVGTRVIVKYSYEDRLPHLRWGTRVPMYMTREVRNYAMASSYHFEVEAPAGIGLRWLRIVESLADGSMARRKDEARAAATGNPEVILHVAGRPTHRFTTAVVEAALAPPLGGLVVVALMGVAITTLCVALGGVHALFPTEFVETGATRSPVASVLLAGPALLLSWLSRAPEHRMVARVLLPVRAILVQTSFVLFGLAFVLAVPLVAPWRGLAWMSLVALQLVTVGQALRLARDVGAPAYDLDNDSRRGHDEQAQ